MPKPGKQLTIQRLQDCFLPVFEQYGILRAILFGSVARGEASRHSDVDLIVVQQTGKRFLARYDGLLYELNKALPEAAVDVLVYTPEELERLAGRAFFAKALREGKVIYESN